MIALAPIGEWMEVQDGQVLAVDDELRLPLSRLAMESGTASCAPWYHRQTTRSGWRRQP